MSPEEILLREHFGVPANSPEPVEILDKPFGDLAVPPLLRLELRARSMWRLGELVRLSEVDLAARRFHPETIALAHAFVAKLGFALGSELPGSRQPSADPPNGEATPTEVFDVTRPIDPLEVCYWSVDEFDQTVRLSQELQNRGLSLVGELAQLTKADLVRLKFHKHAIVAAEVLLADAGVSLGTKIPDWETEIARRGLRPVSETATGDVVTRIEAALKALPAEVRVTRGSPSDAKQITAAETELGMRFPEDYRSFLGAFGSLTLSDDKEATEIVGVRGLEAGQTLLSENWTSWDPDTSRLGFGAFIVRHGSCSGNEITWEDEGDDREPWDLNTGIAMADDGRIMEYERAYQFEQSHASFTDLALEVVSSFRNR
ncbi:MAG: SMI1/KNR4 family protein [Kofleriaceae bacterium]